MNLRWAPSYRHMHEAPAPKTRLTYESAYPSYAALLRYLAIRAHPHAPAGGWQRKPKENARSLFTYNGWHHPVCWMPKLKEGWVRLTFEQFLAYYQIPPFDGRATKP